MSVITDQFFQVDPGFGRHFAGHDRNAGLDQRLAGDAGPLVLRQHCVEHGVGDLVGHLVRMALGHGLGREQVTG
jgi:hypothetical protein